MYQTTLIMNDRSKQSVYYHILAEVVGWKTKLVDLSNPDLIGNATMNNRIFVTILCVTKDLIGLNQQKAICYE